MWKIQLAFVTAFVALFCLSGCDSGTRFEDVAPSQPSETRSTAVKPSPTVDVLVTSNTDEMMEEVRRTVERHFEDTRAGKWTDVLDGSWYAPEHAQALRDPRVRKQVLDAMKANAATIQLGAKNMTVEIVLPKTATIHQGGKVVVVEVDSIFTPRPGVTSIPSTTETSACVSTDYGKTWKVATSLQEVYRVYPKR